MPAPAIPEARTLFAMIRGVRAIRAPLPDEQDGMSEQTSPLHRDHASAATSRGLERAIPRFDAGALTSDWARTTTLLALGAILLAGAFLRLTYINWDDNGHLHPDERFLTSISTDTKAPSSPLNYFDTDTSALNPYNIERENGQRQTTFVYGTLPLFLNKLIASNLDVLTLGQVDNYDNYDHYNLSGRALAGVFDVLTILLVFLIAARLVNRAAGLMAAFLYAFSAFAIQNAHFFVVDPFVAFFATLTIYFSIRVAQEGGWTNLVAAGAAAGLAAACKITAVSLLPVVVLAAGVNAWPGIRPYVAQWWSGDDDRAIRRERNGRALDASIVTLLGGSVVALLAAFIMFRIAMPYAFASPNLLDFFQWRVGRMGFAPVPYPDIMNQQWLRDQVDQQNLLSGDAAFPPNVQWIGRSKWIWPLQQMIAWGMGPAMGITAWAGVLFAMFYAVRRRAWVWLVPLAWVLGYMAFMGAQYSLYMRYFLPLYPTLAVFAGFILWKTLEWGASLDAAALPARFGQRGRDAAAPLARYGSRVAVAAVLVLTMAMGFAFYQIYTQPVTRAEASTWIYENVPEGSVIGHEHWDDIVPYQQPDVPVRAYGSVEFENFGRDDEKRVQDLLADIDAVDYIALSSRRLSGTIPRVPAEWPVTSRYYETLESGELGFEKVKEVTSYPEIFGIELNDTGAEESYSVYDHPKVTIYKKTERYSPELARRVLGADAFPAAAGGTPGKLAQNGILFRPDVARAQAQGGTWSDIFDPSSFANDHPLLVWLFAIELAAFALVPCSAMLFRGLPDRGFLLTKPLGLLVLSYLAHAPSAWGFADYTRGEIMIALGVMVAGGIATAAFWWRELAAWVRARWRFLLFAQAFFLLAFVFAYWLRLQNPDLWHPARGGEKPMDFAYLNGVIRTTDMTQGPIDPWNSGGYLNYYYYGQFIAATVTKLTGIVPEVAYNLIVPMFFAAAVAATFSIAYNLAEATRLLMRRRPGMLPIGRAGPYLAGVFATFLVLLSGNLKAVGVLQLNMQRISAWKSDAPVVGPVITFAGGFWEIIFGDAKFSDVAYQYDWWDPSRAIDVANQGEVSPITEFPYWTFLFADLHAHLMAIPFALTAIGVGLALVLNATKLAAPLAGERSIPRELRSWCIVVVVALIVGALRWINSWDYPPFLLLGAAAILVSERAWERRLNVRMLAQSGAKILAMGLLSFVFFAPIAKNYNQAYSSLHRSDQTTALEDFFSQFGILLFLLAILFIFAVHRSITRNHTMRTLFYGGARGRRPIESALVIGGMALAGAAIVAVGVQERWGVVLLSALALAAIVIAATRELRRPSPTAPVLLFVYAMAALGFGLTGGVELFTLDGDIGRMNTVFKFYLHVWLLWGIVGAYGAWYVFGVMRPQEAFMRRLAPPDRWVTVAPRYVLGAVAVVLVALALVFPYFGTRARLYDRFDPAQGSGNNGMDYMDATVYRDFNDRTGRGGEHVLKYDRDGITWLRENVQGTPTIIEGITDLYHYGSRVSMYTGLPTVSGWGWHQSQQRVNFAQLVEQRQRDVDTFYTTEDVAAARQVLARYGVQYVIVGDVERNWYPGTGLDKFQNGLGGALELAYQNPGMQIWHVIPEQELALRGE